MCVFIAVKCNKTFRSKSCNSFSCREKGNCGSILIQTIYQHNLIGVLFSIFFWTFLHIFWSRFLKWTSIDFFRKNEKNKTDRLSIKSNVENCNLSAYYAVTLFYFIYLALVGTMHLVTTYGMLTVGTSIPFILSGIGYHLYSWAWRLRNASPKVQQKLKKYSSTSSVENFTAVALNAFTLYYVCQELYTNQTEFSVKELEMGGHMTPQFRKLLHLHLAEQNSKIGSSIVCQFVINAFPTFLLKLYEFRISQLRDGNERIEIMGNEITTKTLILIFGLFTFVISPIAIGRSNSGYVIAVVLLFFLRQVYIIYSIAKLSKSIKM